MIRYVCDLCRREIDPDRDIRYQVKIEVRAAFEPVNDDEPDDRDHLEEIQEILESLNQLGEEAFETAEKVLRFDLCAECRKKFLRDPLGRETSKILGFSKN
ncbi:hypothetical protein THTE_3661 [Thermogutta terrifontis]|jgi:hypothetical protein|uniref:Uncharacterized protein n=1 Tax=Thermogutta terrifontis TaxID=1331910 RepID=A0A286RK10_9BACT|nr:hypothetical protein [Thermogutta terrifontis]ASV76262.1 hypothetical protein THTE_3661 [Thermogutta terrifontis]